MYREQESPAAVLLDSTPVHTESPERDFAEATTPVFKVALAGADPIGNSTLRAMLQQSGLAKDTQEWASLDAVKLRHADDVPDVVFLDLSTSMGSELAFARGLSKRKFRPHTSGQVQKHHIGDIVGMTQLDRVQRSPLLGVLHQPALLQHGS